MKTTLLAIAASALVVSHSHQRTQPLKKYLKVARSPLLQITQLFKWIYYRLNPEQRVNRATI